MKIKSIVLREILNSFAKPGIEIETNNVHASAPAGTSRGKWEAPQIPPKTAIKRFPKKKMVGRQVNSVQDIFAIEKELDPNHLGGNTILAFSYSLLKLLALEKGKEVYQLFGKKKIPTPLCKIVGGGKHAKGPKIQEFLVFSKKRNFNSQVREISEFFHFISPPYVDEPDFSMRRRYFPSVRTEQHGSFPEPVRYSTNQGFSASSDMYTSFRNLIALVKPSMVDICWSSCSMLSTKSYPTARSMLMKAFQKSTPWPYPTVLKFQDRLMWSW